MKLLFKADIAEKLILNNEELLEIDFFKIGGKILFNDLSSLKYINNLSFLEKNIPNIERFEYKEFKTSSKNNEAKTLIMEMNGTQTGKYLDKALIIFPTPQDRAEGDYEFIVLFKNGETAVKNFSGNDYNFYSKIESDGLISSFGLDTYLVHKKLEKDFESVNKLNLNLKYKG